MSPKILVVDDDMSHRKMIDTVLSAEGYTVFQADDGDTAVKEVEKQFFDLIIMDLRMKRMDGVTALHEVKKISPALPVIIMTAYASVKTAVDTLKLGAYDYLTKPVESEELKIIVDKVLHHQQLEQENLFLKERLNKKFNFSNIIASSEAMSKLFHAITLAAPTEATVLITGESGTGKELIANAIHENSLRYDKTFIKINCAALPENLLESELFGHKKGAFTGAESNKKGRFHLADKGSIFLDEITEMSLTTQVKLLRVLQEREFDPLGSIETIKVDTRIIAVTNKDLETAVKEGKFREDLYFRMNVINVKVPPLRDRKEDIPVLADFFLKKYSEKNQILIKGFVPKSMDLLMRYNWPGNVRELENVIERAVIMSRGEMITAAEFPDVFRELDVNADDKVNWLPSGKSLKEIEKQMILQTLEESDGNRTHAADILGISRRTLQIKLKEYGIN
jgi:two-component system response regulator HydG